MNLVKNGWLNIYKPEGITSSTAILKIKKKFNLNKVGHAGTLDLRAKGILPVAFGNTTKIISYAMNKKKEYKFIIKWGQQTTTDDTEGETIHFSNKMPNKFEINNMLKNYIGNLNQIPPNYSSIKVRGERAYKLSRKNKNFNLLPRKVIVYDLKYIKKVSNNESLFFIKCGSGFYVRSLARDLAMSLGTRGHVSEIERLKVGIFNIKNTILLDDLLKIRHLSDGILGFYPSSVVLDDIPALTVNSEEVFNIRMGKKINISFLNEKLSNVFYSGEVISIKNNKNLIALGYIENNFFKPKKVFNEEV